MSITPSKMVTYSYDSQGRLLSASFPNGAQATYSYDAMGNRTTVMEVPGTSTDCCPPTVAALPKKQAGDFLYHAMLVMLSDGRIVGWGDSSGSVLANGYTAGSAAAFPIQDVCYNTNTTMPPSTASIADWAFVNSNLYIVFDNGWVYSAGRNDYGQLGLGDTTARPYLTRIDYFVTNSISIEKVWAAGSAWGTNGGGCVYFQGSDNTLYGCGNNLYGNLGRPSPNQTTNATTPVACSGVTTSPYVVDVKIAVINNAFSTYLRMSDKTLLVAGYNGNGQLAQNNTTNVTGSFVAAKKTGNVAITDVEDVSAVGGWNGSVTGAHAFVLDSSKNVWAVGYNLVGQLGIGSTTQQTLFIQVSALSNITEVKAAGGLYGYSYALDGSGALYTWGYNGVNNLFRNNTTNVTTAGAATYLPGSIAQVFRPRSDNLSTNSQLIVLTSSGLLAYAGQDNGQLGVANTVNPGAYKYILMPRAFLDGTEEISDVFVHGWGTTQRLFILSATGLLYASGNNADSICTGGVTSNSSPTNFTWSKINFTK